MLRGSLLVVALAACYQPTFEQACQVMCPAGACPGELVCGLDARCHGAGAVDCSISEPGDGGVDGLDPTAYCFGAGGFRVCLDQAPLGVVNLPPVIDTDTYPCAAMTSQPKDCVITGERIIAEITVRVTGSRPLVLVASDAIVVTGNLDVSSKRSPLSLGAGHDDGSCAPSGLPTPSTSGGGGAAGGSFRAMGGNGSFGNAGTTQYGISSLATSQPPTLRGGCAGGTGGGDGMVAGGQAGSSGGAVALIAGSSITVTGVINASGEGGAGGTTRTGGGGGGSGGMIVLDAPTISIGEDLNNLARLFVSGGAGGGGGASTGTDASTTGHNGTESTGPTVQGDGGTGGSNPAGGADGGPGGDGSSCASSGSGFSSPVNGEALAGGGGGGGASGFILLLGDPAPALVPGSICP